MTGTGLFSPTTSAPVKIALTDDAGNALLVKSTAANIPSAVAGYAVGCLLIATDTGALYSNTGTATSASFVLFALDSSKTFKR